MSMRELINNILQDTSKDMREQADRVENAFARRIEEMAGAKAKMENQLENVRFFFISVFNSLLIRFSLCFNLIIRLLRKSLDRKIILLN